MKYSASKITLVATLVVWWRENCGNNILALKSLSKLLKFSKLLKINLHDNL